MPSLRLLSLLLLTAAPLTAQRDACDRDQGDDDREHACEIRLLGSKGLRALRIDPGANGGADVEAWDRDSVAIEARIVTYGRTQEDARALGREVKITYANAVLSADGPETGRREGWTVVFVMKVPRKIDLDIETTNGPIGVEGVNGNIQVEAVNGPITLQGVSGDVRARLQNGPLTIALTGDHWEGTGLDASTVNGPLSIRVPDHYNAKLETGTRNGPFHTDIPITVQGSVGRVGQSISTTLGRGGATLRATTTNGPLNIRSR